MRFGKDEKETGVLSSPSMENGYEFIPHSYRPFSYYVLGGIDIDGDSLSLNGGAVGDESGDLMSANGAGLGYDPRTSGFDIAEEAGNDVYEGIRTQAATARHQSLSEGSSGESFLSGESGESTE